MDRSGFKHFLPITLRWKDNDVYGHVNNVEYYSFFDTVINDFLIRVGGLDIHGGAVIGLCVESQCTFKAPLEFPGVVDAGLRVGRVGNSSVRYDIGLFAEAADEPAATGRFVHVFVDRADRRPVPIPDGIRQALEGISA
ncbi:acyl-CoA thioesterase [Kribbella sandramycini]|uniref:Acyl-CoA thioester hydrolase n=1 Tax=Kribbella sandramycini TaxID=60450 RepID=A0A7Y4L1H0_9ACTN|nr:thioesterase family protein [Kribbella sandramycini]MBB6565505.1 acyl-CoA thioester hydrolase [Kribbella sandramycini]NOL41772.1 acyl-CoA thioesterase [Kribbella sandramycini]